MPLRMAVKSLFAVNLPACIKNTVIKIRKFSLILISVFCTNMLCFSLAIEACETWVAKVISVQGQVEHLTTLAGSSTVNWNALEVDHLVCPGDSVRLAAFSRASLYLSNNTFLRLDEKTLINFPSIKGSESFWIELKQGIGHFISRIKNRFEVSTPYVNAAVDGTEFVVQVADDETNLSVIEGTVVASSDSEQISLLDGEALTATGSSISRQVITVHPRDSVAWAIYFPPVLSLEELASDTVNPLERKLLAAANIMVKDGRSDLALKEIESELATMSPENRQQSDLNIAIAALLLSVGNTNEANRLLEKTLQSDSNNGLAYALQALISAILSEPETALANAERALQLNSESAAIYIAYSYADQSAQQLIEAREHATLATQVAPTNPLAWSRLSEVQLILGNITEAGDAIEKALKLAPGDPIALTRAGLLNLMKLNFDQGKDQLQKSLVLDSTNPDTRLGLALAYTREGKIEQGRQQMEYAVSLNPASSVLRSYLGRIYFEENRDAEAQVQWGLAQEFDPFDPSPHFYEGVQKLFENDPVGAAESLKTSNELNANRGVYRSESLLNSDTATRSATLGRVYNEMGFDQAVFSEAWDALKNDPTSSDGHRLLADRYATLPRHEAARTSELLQSQLWQPLSAYPLQPQLSESDTTVISGLGPQRPGLNEYHSLFTQDGVYATLNAIGGSDDTWGEDIVISGLNGPLALSVGQFHYESAGFRENLDQQEDIYNGLFQWQLSPSLRAQLEIRKRQSNTKTFVLEDIDPDAGEEKKELETITSRFGLSYQFNDKHSILLSAVEQDFEEFQYITDEAITASFERSPRTIEFQHIYTDDEFYTQFGFGQSKLNPENIVDSVFFSSVANSKTTYRNVYFYSGYELNPLLFVNAGLSYNWFDEKTKSITVTFQDAFEIPGRTEKRQWSPKFGISYSPTDKTTFRASAFRTFKRNIAANQTIEPVHMTGFNQKYDDDNTSDAKVYAVGIDYKDSQRLKLGMESIFRDVEVPLSLNTLEDGKPKQFDNFHRLYYYQTFGSLAALNTEIQYEDLDLEFNSNNNNGDIHRISTITLPISLKLYPQKQFNLAFELIYVKQVIDIDFDTLDTKDEFKESDWITNLRFSFRLPKRIGLLELGVDNVGGSNREFLDSDLSNVRYYPERFFYGRIQLAF